VILINKADLASEAQISTLEGIVHGINPLAITHRTTQSNIDLGLVMNLNAYAARMPPASVPETYHHHNHVDGKCSDPESHPKSTHYTIRGISSILVPVPILPAAQVEVLDEWIRSVLWEHKLPNEEDAEGLDVLRCKGMFRTDAGGVYVLQGVREMYDLSLTESTGDSDGAGEIGKLVFIGKGLDDRVRTSLETAVRV
jgi:G3E family GTPase